VSVAGRRIVVITGMSGSGKSTAVRALEDAGYFCIDNLPAPLLLKVTELAGPNEAQRLAFVMDVREGHFLEHAPKVLDEARRSGHDVQVLFLDASDQSLMQRYQETRRRHPLAPGGSVAEGIAKERAALRELREQSQAVLDTSSMTVHQLKAAVQQRFATEDKVALSMTLVSFGYRHGVPPQADLVFDARFLPNPFFVPDLKALTGKDPKVASYVLDRPEAWEFLDKIVEMLEFLLPRFQREGRSYLTVAIGCTGGKHRSVAIVHALEERLKDGPVAPRVWDRDVEKE
jgi:RNase adapter protein RapZ